MDGFDSDENLNGLYVEGLADRIWDDGDEWARGQLLPLKEQWKSRVYYH